ncbi:hypothetical protein BKA62DRAFT_702215 [Auriculariales sp. MPI-PUGE-AT-0066]|nr:hypothetical protein BKA62DRAFT_702215 [Auriculariales sp. MPI-PUGE-AT-0066]
MPPPLPIELCLTIAEYAANAAIYDYNWSWMAELCSVCQSFLPPMRSILYDAVQIHDANFGILELLASDQQSWFICFTRHIVVDVLPDPDALLLMLIAVQKLESVHMERGDNIMNRLLINRPSVTAMHLHGPYVILENPTSLAATVEHFHKPSASHITHWHFSVFLRTGSPGMPLLDTAVLDHCSITHVLIDVDTYASGHNGKLLYALAKLWTRPPRLSRLVFRPSPHLARDDSGRLIFLSIMREPRRFAITMRDERVWMSDLRPSLADKWDDQLGLRIHDMREGARLWLSGRPLCRAPSPDWQNEST